jgi:N-acetylmuramoyl-L-alanine amidase
VRELHSRLDGLGYRCADAPDTFGDATHSLVEAFQHARGLALTGEVDDVTWARLEEAGWSLGDRLLYVTTPLLRGDDVADLQVHLAQLGFNPGRIDGIFGASTAAALVDFQRHRGLDESATLTRATLAELHRMVRRDADGHLVTDALDLATAAALLSGPIVVCGGGPLVNRVARECAAFGEARNLGDLSCEEVASQANALGASLVLSFEMKPTLDVIHVHYWASYRSHSRRGERLASALASRLSHTPDLSRVEVTGMALPILRETTMTTLHIEHGEASEVALGALARDVALVVHNRD